MDIKIKHLYEVAVITAFTATPKQNATGDGKELDSPQVAPQIVANQLLQNHYWAPVPTGWNFMTGHGDNSWTSSALVNAHNQVSGHPCCVEDAPSVSKFTSEESTASWETDTWSRESLVSQESLGDPNYPLNYVNYANYAPRLPNPDSGFMDPESAFDAMVFYSGPINPNDILQDEVPFISGPVHPEDLCKTENYASVVPYCEVAGEGQVRQHNQFDVMLERVAQDLTSLEVNPTESTTWQAPTPIYEMYGDSLGADQTFYNSFQNVGSDGSHQEFYAHQQNIISWPTHGVCLSSTAPFETDRCSHSIADSGQVSRASSMTSLAATYSDVSEDNMADMESCESINSQRVKLFKPKLNSAPTRGNIYPSKASATSQEKSQARMSAFVDTSSQNIRQSTDSYRSTSGCSESVASYSLSSDSEMEPQSHVNKMNLAQWADLKRATLSAIHPTEASKSATRSISGCSESVASYSLSSDSEMEPQSHVNKMNIAQWTDLKRATLSAIHPTEAANSAIEWKPNVYQDSQFGVDPSYASRPNVYHNQHNETSLWDSGLDNTSNMTHLWDTSKISSKNKSNNTTNAFTHTHYNESRYHIENPPFDMYPSCNSFNTCYTNDNAKLAAHEPPPYNCSLDHGSEFIPVEDLDVTKLPLGCQRWEHLNTILEISHRVVKLRVHKQFKMTQQEYDSSGGKSAGTSDDEEPVLEHYGTGFACHVGAEMVVIRTHSELVGSSLEASSTDVIFVLTFPNRSLNREIICTGVPGGFCSNDYSQTTKFMCKTPPDLISYLHLFKDVPVVRQKSIFNDSSYFSDSSPDTSASGLDELENDQKGTTLQKDNEDTSKVRLGTDVTHRAGMWGRPLTGPGNSSYLYSHVLANRNEESLKHTTQTASCFEHSLDVSAERHQKVDYTRSQQEHAGLSVNIADYEHEIGDSLIAATSNAFINLTNQLILPDDTIIIKGNLSPGQSYQPRTVPCQDNLHWNAPDASWQNCEHIRPGLSTASQYHGFQQVTTLPSPLVIMEKRYDVLNSAPGTTYCPYADLNIFGCFGAYTNFSSFAGDVFNSLALDDLNGSTSKTGDSEDTTKWEYEKLLFLQNQHRQSYNKLHVPAKHRNTGRGGDLQNAPSQDAHRDTTQLSRETSVSIAAQECSECKSLANGEKASSKPSATYSETLVELQKPVVDPPVEDRQRCDKHSNVNPESSRLLKESDGSSRSTLGSDRRNVFAEFSSVNDYLDTWDIELLNLDTDLNPLPDEDLFETMVSNLLKDSDDPRQCTPAFCPQDNFSQRSSRGDSCASTREASMCLVISHPHGGPKMISTGLFSRHRHVGGTLYDTPTCMGSCGAPVVAFTENAVSPYLTHFVHSGTVKVNGVPVGAGVSYFDT